MKKNKTMIVCFLLPALTFFILIFLYPICRTILMSFFKIEGVTDSMSKWTLVGFGNFTKLFHTRLFTTSLWNIFRIWFIGGAVVMALYISFYQKRLLQALPVED